MNLHEYQAKDILRSYGIPIPLFVLASTVQQVEERAASLGLEEAVLKIQVHAGGRGKAGGVQIARGKEQILKAAQQLLGMKMVGPQTSLEGVIAKKVMITPILPIEKEYYLSVVVDRKRAQPLLIASAEGGMEIEELGTKSPDKIIQIPIEISGKIRHFHLVRLMKFLGWGEDLAKQGMQIVQSLAKAFIEIDASLLEINPLVLSKGELIALDAKCSIDDNALFRQVELAKLYDPSQYSKAEVEAKAFDLSYIAMQGNIGCMVNGAGLAMATMDLIQHFGGKPANFLDVGGSASKEKIARACKIILEDPQVKVVLVNIFGGIMDCALLAQGIIDALTHITTKVPFVVRMEGTHVEEGKKILEKTQHKLITAFSLEEAARKAVSLLESR